MLRPQPNDGATEMRYCPAPDRSGPQSRPQSGFKGGPMSNNAQFAQIATLAGDPARATILHALMDGRALTASELARAAGIAPQTASGHLQRLVEAGLLSVTPQGRHRYHRLASAAVAEMIEAIMRIAARPSLKDKAVRVGPRDTALRRARTCYDHLAGELGVALADALVRAGHLDLETESANLTDRGLQFLSALGIDVATNDTRRSRRADAPLSGRMFCRPCLDWSERRLHLAGRAGAALCAHSFAAGWIRLIDGTRAVAITPKGARIFKSEFGAILGAPSAPSNAIT